MYLHCSYTDMTYSTCIYVPRNLQINTISKIALRKFKNCEIVNQFQNYAVKFTQFPNCAAKFTRFQNCVAQISNSEIELRTFESRRV